MKRVIVFQHHTKEGPASLCRWLEADSAVRDTVQLGDGESIPDIDGYDALWVMGGAMNVWDVDEHPWLVEEKRVIKRWVLELGRPFLGLCLGHQLLADALGGECGKRTSTELGVFDVELTTEGQADPLFAGIPARFKAMQWHGVDVVRPPEGAVVLAKSPQCAVEAMRVGRCAWSMQYHAELDEHSFSEWEQLPTYLEALESTLGSDGVARVKGEVQANVPDFVANSKRLYRNFKATAFSGGTGA